MDFIAYIPNGEGCFLQVGAYPSLLLAITALVAADTGSKVEQLIEGGSVTVYTKS
jgi:hypothetical protein